MLTFAHMPARARAHARSHTMGILSWANACPPLRTATQRVFDSRVRLYLSFVSFVVLLLSYPIAVGRAGSPERASCGFPLPSATVHRSDGDVPLLLRPTPYAAAVAAFGAAERRRHRGENANSARRCPRASAYLRRIVRRLVKGSQLETLARVDPGLTVMFQCARLDGLPVAKAGPGNLLVPGALLVRADSEDAVAAVLGHELAHVALRHPERLTQIIRETPSAARGSVKSAHEREADVTGLRIMVRAGYDPHAAVDHMRAVDDLARAWGGSDSSAAPRALIHDEVGTRIARLNEQIAACGYVAAKRRSSVPAGVIREATGMKLVSR